METKNEYEFILLEEKKQTEAGLAAQKLSTFDNTVYVDVATDSIIERSTLDTVNRPFIRNSYNGRFIKPKGEENFEPSQTVPDQSMSISEIYKRFANGGLPPNVQKNDAMYHFDEFGRELTPIMPDLKKLDMADAQLFAETELEAITASQKKKAEKLRQKGDKSPEEAKKPQKSDSTNQDKPDSDPNAGDN